MKECMRISKKVISSLLIVYMFLCRTSMGSGCEYIGDLDSNSSGYAGDMTEQCNEQETDSSQMPDKEHITCTTNRVKSKGTSWGITYSSCSDGYFPTSVECDFDSENNKWLGIKSDFLCETGPGALLERFQDGDNKIEFKNPVPACAAYNYKSYNYKGINFNLDYWCKSFDSSSYQWVEDTDEQSLTAWSWSDTSELEVLCPSNHVMTYGLAEHTYSTGKTRWYQTEDVHVSNRLKGIRVAVIASGSTSGKLTVKVKCWKYI